MTRLRVFSFALAGAAMLAGCGGSGSSHSAVPSTKLTRAAYVTGNGVGYKLSLTVDVSGAGQNATVTASGAIDQKSRRGSLSMSAAGVDIDEVLAPGYIYLRAPSLESKIGTPWAKVSLDAATNGGDVSSSSESDPTEALSYLKASGDVTREGNETIRGVASVHYHAIVDLERWVTTLPAAKRAAKKASLAKLERALGTKTLPIDVYIDAKGRVTRMAFQIASCTAQGKITAAITLDLYDYGPQQLPATPPPDQVTDISSKIRQQTAAALKQLHC